MAAAGDADSGPGSAVSEPESESDSDAMSESESRSRGGAGRRCAGEEEGGVIGHVTTQVCVTAGRTCVTAAHAPYYPRKYL